MAELNIQLSEDEIERLINGEIISIPTDFTKRKANINKINIMQSFAADIAAPLVNRENKVVSQTEIENIKRVTASMTEQMMKTQTAGTFRLNS